MTETDFEKYTDYIVEKLKQLLAIDSPTGYTEEAADFVWKEFTALGYAPEKTVKGGVIVFLGGRDQENSVLLESHVDTLGGIVSEVRSNGRLRISPLGGLEPNNAEAENVCVITKFSGIYEGTFQMEDASVHVNGEYGKKSRAFDGMEVVPDEDVRTKEDTEAIGISVGDIVCFDPRTRITKSGYIKSRFLDDKLSVAILLGYARYLKEYSIIPERGIWVHVTVYEEVGHGGCTPIPEGVTEAVSVDMGCVGETLSCTEKQVSICAKDSHGPYAYEVVKCLIEAAKRSGADYAVDVYPHYGSDVEASLSAGANVRHGLIGAGVYASHGYERSHRDGAKNVLKLLTGYLG